jgi:hypothetical protein
VYILICLKIRREIPGAESGIVEDRSKIEGRKEGKKEGGNRTSNDNEIFFKLVHS